MIYLLFIIYYRHNGKNGLNIFYGNERGDSIVWKARRVVNSRHVWIK